MQSEFAPESQKCISSRLSMDDDVDVDAEDDDEAVAVAVMPHSGTQLWPWSSVCVWL